LNMSITFLITTRLHEADVVVQFKTMEFFQT